MTPRTIPWRATALLTACSMTLGSIPVLAAPPPIADQEQVSPPSRVGRLARYTGTVSFHTADETQWSPAILNYPITTGNALWTEPGATAFTDVSGNNLALDGATELDIATLDDHSFVGSEPQGELYLDLQQVPNGDTYTLQTPRGAVQIAATGRYEIIAGDTTHPTTVTVVQGAAQITGTHLALQVGPGQTASINGADTFQGSVGPMAQDAFLTGMLAQEQPAPRAATPIPPVVAQMTGYQDLAQNGTWQDTPQNGTVWYPRVESDWVPYRHGRWSYVAPWGWTWIDEAPWGFAPFHYGRWIQTDNRWGWVPAEPVAAGVPTDAYPAPVYAPALVSFVDIAGAAAVGAAVGLAAGALLGGGDRSVGWVPLGPNEPYYPPYSNRLDYVRRLNGPNIRNTNQVITNTSIHNVTNITNNHVVMQNFVNRGGATVVPAAAMARSTPIAASARPLAPDQLARARAQFGAPIHPTAATAGVTPAVARQFNIAQPARPAAAAGPAINPAAFHPPAARGATPAFVPPLRPAGATAAAPGQPATPGEASRPGAPGEPARPGAPGPAIEPGRPGAPGAQRPGEPVRPGTPGPAIEAGRPGSPNPATEAARPGAPGSAIEPGRPGAPGPATEAPRPGAPGPTPEAARPGGLPALRPAETPAQGAARPPGAPAGTPASRPAPAAEPARPTPQPAPEAARPPAASQPRPAAPPPAPARPAEAPRVAPAARPAPPPPVQARPAAPPRVAPPQPAPRPAPAARPAPPQRPAAPKPAPRPQDENR
jgi:hypothetical protein